MGKKKKIVKEAAPPLAPAAGSRWSERIPICIIILCAFLIRLCHIYSIIHNDPNYLNFAGTDMDAYDQAAMQIVSGTLPREPYTWYPAYCYFVAGVYFIFGHNPVAVMVVQSLLSCITCFLTYLIGKKIFNKPIGIISALICGIYSTRIMYSAVLLSPALDTFLVTLAVFIGIKSIERGKVYSFVLGVILGLSVLSRPNMLLVAPFFLIYILIMVKGIKKSLLASLLVIAGIVMTIAPVTIHNYMYSHGKFIPIVTGGSLELWVGNNEDSDGTYYVSPLEKYIEQRWEKLGKDPYLSDTIEFITKKPDKFCLLLLKKLALFWNAEGIHDNNIMYERIREKSPILWLSLPFGLMAPFALTGMVLLLLGGYLRNSGQAKSVVQKPEPVSEKALHHGVLLLYLVIFGFMNSIILFFVQSRVRQPIIACLMIFASFAIYWFYKNIWKQKSPYKARGLLLFAVIFSIFYGLVNTQYYMRWLYPIIKPDGFYIEKRYGTVIRDDSGIWHGNRAVDLNAEDKVLKKELMIDFEPTDKEKGSTTGKGIGVNMFYSCNGNGSLRIEINGKKIPDINLSQFASGGFYRIVRLGIKPEFFRKGLNTIIFRVTKDTFLQIPIDNYYKYKRSMFSIDAGKSWQVKNGEYMIYLDLQKI